MRRGRIVRQLDVEAWLAGGDRNAEGLAALIEGPDTIERIR